MSEENNAAENTDEQGTPAEAPEPKEAPATEQPKDAPKTEEKSSDDEPLSKNDAIKLRAENKGFRDKVQAAEQARITAERAATKHRNDLEKVQGELIAAQAQLKNMQIDIGLANISQTPEIGAKRPEPLRRLINLEKIEFDDEGNLNPESLKQQLLELKAEVPELFYTGLGSVNGGDFNPANGHDMNAILRQQLRK